MKRLGERDGGNFLLLKIIVGEGGENFLYVYYFIVKKEVVSMVIFHFENDFKNKS